PYAVGNTHTHCYASAECDPHAKHHASPSLDVNTRQGSLSGPPNSVPPGVTPGITRGGPGRILISQVLYDPGPGIPDPGGEWVVLWNPSSGAVRMVGWSLRDAQNATGLPEIELRGGATVLVAAAEAGDSTFPPTTSRIILPGRIGNGLRNDGDVLTLLDGAGSPVDAVSWGDNRSALDPPVPAAMPGQPIRRSGDSDSDSARDWGAAAGTAAPAALLLPAPSASALAAGPGEQAQNVGITPAVPVGKGSPAAGGQAVDELVLSEIAPHAGWVELYNRGASPVDIRQWTLSDAAGCHRCATTRIRRRPGGARSDAGRSRSYSPQT
ncbi:MAG TPA: lamin tail domain-containing protein, partial [Herpetosiphonaceae bacterium]|nr:lamin tail domain-containing protein [Herpetosiphonaceae bacterium]